MADLKFLIVDPAGGLEVRSHLRQAGFGDIDVATSGLAALEILRRELHDVVLAEWQCTDMSGLELLGAIRRDGTLRHVRFSLLTASRAPDNIQMARDAGVQGYIVKPYSLGTLKQKIQALLATPPAVAKAAG